MKTKELDNLRFDLLRALIGLYAMPTARKVRKNRK
jgi:hypothetical protein